MIKPGEAIVIEPTANGWMVRAAGAHRDNAVTLSDVMVFTEKGGASTYTDSGEREKCLLSWIDDHFGSKT